nr:rRNA maturation RNase YbeY [Brevundimonas alba]
MPEAAAVAQRAATAALGTVEGDVVVLLTDDAAVQDLNARFRDKDRPTNVLSFPAAESATPHLGDLVLAYGVCAAEAQAQGKSLADHLSHLTVHGVLHLLGRDHVDEGEAEEMEAEERSILATLGVADPYRADADA